MLEADVRWAAGGAFELSAAFVAAAGVTAVFGPSGAGKTTLLNLIAGLARPTAGRIVLDGQVLVDRAAGTDLPAHRRRVGYVFQDARLFPHLSVARNLTFGGRDEDLARVADLLDIAPLLDRRPATLSAGEAQRVALGRAVMAEPRLLLMDEPLANLDARRRGEILPYIERLRDETGIGIVYVSHTVEEVTRLADHVLFLDEGRLAAAGPVADVMGRPELMALAGRGGAGALLEGRVRARDPETGLAEIAMGEAVITAPDGGQPVGEPVRLRLRARDVLLARTAPDSLSAGNRIPATVMEIERREPAVHTVRLAHAGQAFHALVSAPAMADLGIAEGDAVVALVDTASLDPPIAALNRLPAAPGL